MPPRYTYWTILIDGAATAFRAKEREELLPTLNQLSRKSQNVEIRFFSRGKLWDSPEQAQWAGEQGGGPRESRGREWRPGGNHADPRARFDRKPPRPVREDDRPRWERRAEKFGPPLPEGTPRGDWRSRPDPTEPEPPGPDYVPSNEDGKLIKQPAPKPAPREDVPDTDESYDLGSPKREGWKQREGGDGPERSPESTGDARRPRYDNRESGSRPPRRDGWKPREGGDGPRKPWVPREGDDRPRASFREGGYGAPKRQGWTPREGGERKPWVPREGGERRPYTPREGGERRPYTPREGGDRPERKPWSGDRDRGPREGGERRPYTPREGGDRKPWTPREGGDRRPFTPREGGPGAPKRDGWKPREGGDRKPWTPRAEGDRPRKPWTPREGGDRKPWTPRPEGPGAPKRDGWKPRDGGDRGPRSGGKPWGGDRKGPGSRPGGFKPRDGGKPPRGRK